MKYCVNPESMMSRTVSMKIKISLLAIIAGLVLQPGWSNPGSWRGQSIVEFNDQDGTIDWGIVNDGVMGGLSKGNLERTDAGTVKFFGDLSLQNNGGFTTMRSSDVRLNLSDDLGLLLHVKGDGRTYDARLDSSARYRGRPVSFSAKFKTTKGTWQQIKIPFTEFKGSFRGTDLPGKKLDPSVVERIWILLGDKQEGPFTLEMDWIRTFGKGQGNVKEEKKSESSDTQPEK